MMYWLAPEVIIPTQQGVNADVRVNESRSDDR